MLNNALMLQQGSKLSTPPIIPLAGQLQFATSNAITDGFYRSVNYGVTWTSKPPTTSFKWRDVSCSSTGIYVIVSKSTSSGLYVSSDYGVSYNIYGASYLYDRVECSGTGQYQYAATTSTDAFFRSSDYGVSWSSPISIAAGSNDTVKCDKTGQYVIVGKSSSADYPYLSTNYGATFNQITGTIGAGYVTAATLSSTGQYQYICIYNFGIYASSDYGSSWSLVFIDLSGSYQFNSMSCNSTGQYIMAGDYLSNIWQSSDYGASFYNQGASYGSHYDCQMTSDGVYRLDSGKSSSGIHVSSNSGSTYSTGILILASDVTGVALNTVNA